MKIVIADPTRMIDLPGVGPSPRPVDIDQSVSAFRRLKSLRIYRFAADVTIEGESEEDEVFVLPLDGAITIQISGTQTLCATLAPSGTNRALYMAPGHSYQLSTATETHVAYARAAGVGSVPVQSIAKNSSENLAEVLQFQIVDLSAGSTIDLGGKREPLVHLIKGEMATAQSNLAATSTLVLVAGEKTQLVARGQARLLIVSA